VCLDGIKILTVRQCTRREPRIVDGTDPASLCLVIVDDRRIPTDVIRVVVRAHEVVDPCDVVSSEILEYVFPVVVVVARVDEHRLAVGFDNERTHGLPDVDVVNFERAVGRCDIRPAIRCCIGGYRVTERCTRAAGENDDTHEKKHMG